MIHASPLLFTTLASLVSTTLAGPMHHNQTFTLRNFVPDNITWQSTANSTQDPMAPAAGPVKACQRTTYYSSTPAAGIRRGDCLRLASQVGSGPGYWMMWSWHSTTDYETLVSNGTCNFAISLLDGEVSGHNHTGDVAIIGNSDVVDILNHVLSYGSGEDINSDNIAGEMNCEWYISSNTTMSFVVRNNIATQETDSRVLNMP